MTQLAEPAWLWVTAALALAEWLAVWRNRRRLNWLLKPAVMVALIAWFSLAGKWSPPLVAFGVALIFSLLGDILLLMPARLFLAGLLAFLCAHLAYLVALNPTPPPLNASMLVIIFAVGTLVGAVAPRIRRKLQASSGGRKLLVGVTLYSLVLTLMMLSAVATLFRADWQPGPARMVALGGVLFFISDLTLGIDRFVREIRFGRVVVMVTYYLAQIALAVGAVMNYA